MRQIEKKGRFAVYSDAYSVGKAIDVHKEVKRHNIEIAKDRVVMRANTNVATANGIEEKLDISTWLPFAAPKYQISSDINDYLFVPVFTIPSGIPNRNGVAFPLKTLLEFNIEAGCQGYKTFRGKPMHYEHCFPKGTLITTGNGYKTIEKIKVGDLVLTHKGNYKKVVKLYANKAKAVSKLRVMGMGTIFATSNHPFEVVDKRQIFGALSKDVKKTVNYRLKKESFDVVPHFRPVSDIYSGDYIVRIINVGGDVSVSPSFAFIAGLFTAEGSFQYYKGIRKSSVFTLGIHETELVEELAACLDTEGVKYRTYDNEKGGTTTFVVRDETFAKKLFDVCGEYSHKKYLKDVKSWTDESLRNFLAGYVCGDGNTGGNSNSRVRTVTVSKKLALDIQMLWARLGVPASITVSDKGTYNTVNGKVKARRKSYHVGVSNSNSMFLNDYLVGKTISDSPCRNQDRLIVTDKYLLLPVLGIEHNYKTEDVFNFEVEDDNSYSADGVSVHNCNENPLEAKGVIADSFLRKLNGYGNGKVWKVMLLLAVDRTKDVNLSKEIADGKMNSYSMGAWVDRYTCSYCGADVGKCDHIPDKSPLCFYEKDGKLVFKNMHGINGFECSSVGTPAWSVATSDIVMS